LKAYSRLEVISNSVNSESEPAIRCCIAE
jgi:hypothetical protein